MVIYFSLFLEEKLGISLNVKYVNNFNRLIMSGMVKFCHSTCNTYTTPQKYKRKVYNPIFIIKKIIKIIKIIWMMKLLLNLTKPLMVEF